MTMDQLEQMDTFRRKHDYLVCIDSDGCVFDAMEIKHKECFCPAYIEYFSLQAVSKYARDAWEFANLYSDTRGIHRLLALLHALDLLSHRSEVKERGFTVPMLPNLRDFIKSGLPLSNDGMKTYIETHPDAEDVKTTLAWSIEVNTRIGRMVHGVPPFPHVRESLQLISEQADIVIVSATQTVALKREWTEHDILHHVSLVCGQEQGSKSHIIRSLAPQYAPDHILMIGDAPGDQKAAHDNSALFYPICPDWETESWSDFAEHCKAFFEGNYAGETEDDLIQHFRVLLPTYPAWDIVD